MPNTVKTPTAEEESSLTIGKFCLLEDMSVATYHKLKNRGLGPHELRIPGMAFIRITAAARKEWHARMEALRQEQSHELELQRRREHTSRAGKIAAASPRHISKQRRRA